MNDITPAPIHDYCVKHSREIEPIFAEIAKVTSEKFPQVQHMQVGELEGNFLRIITKLISAERVLEFGTFTGCSSTAFALALPAHGKVTTLDRDPIATSFAKTFWAKAYVSEKVELILGDAKDTVKTLLAEVKSSARKPYDLSFIDADKAGYSFYFESSLNLLRSGGAILVDNVLWAGYVVNPEDESDRRMAAFNDMLKKDARVELVVLPIRDGITLAIKK